MQIIKATGKIIADKIPIFKLLLKAFETNPTNVGPPEQPTSPANAKNANIAVPPPFMLTADILNVPGQRIPTESPHSPHPRSPNTADDVREIIKYDIIQSMPLKSINLFKSNL